MMRFLKTRLNIHKLLAGLLVFLVGGALVLNLPQSSSAAQGPITGNVFNDSNANGVKDAGEGAFSSLAIVNLYNSSGTYVKSRTSDSSGNFSLAGLGAGTYYISVYNTARTALLNTAPGLLNTIGSNVEQTYASVGTGAGAGSGPVCVSAAPTYTQRANHSSSPSEWTVGAQNGTSAGPCFGGRNATMTNPALTTLVPPIYSASTDYTNLNTGLNTQKNVSKVILTTDGGVSNVDFGLSANAVTHTGTSGQGSLSQFIANSNLNSGAHAMRFTPAVPTNQTSGSNTWWRIDQGTSPLDTITASSVTIDGRAYSNTNGSTQLNTNSGTLTGPIVGTTDYKIDDFQKPELELAGDPRSGGATSLLRVNANTTTIANLAFNSTVNYPSSDSTFIEQSGGVGIAIENNLMGVNPATGANSSNRPRFAIQTAYLLSLNATGAYRHNFISSNDSRGMILAGGLLGGGNVVALLLGDWIIEQNDGPSAGVAFGGGVTRISVRHNNMPIAALDAGSLNASLGLHTLTENTISGGGGIQLHAGLQNTITKNNIKNATGSNPGISMGNLSTGNYVSQNSFGGNGGNAIDLNSDGASDNSLVNCLTLSPELVGLANLGLARPSITNARLQGSTLTVDVNYCAIGVFDVEIYKAAAGSGDSNAGEGQTYLGTFEDLALINGTVSNRSLTVSGVNPGDALSAIVVDTVTGNTSEFGPNTTATSPPAAPTSAPDMTAATDSGDSNIDNLTNDSTPTFTGTCTNGEEVTLYVDGQAIAPTQVCAGGAYSITPTTPLVDGAHTIRATFKNGSGESATGPILTFTIDTQAPAAPAAPDMTNSTDTGASNSDNITNNPRPSFTGTCTVAESTALYIDGQLAATALCVDGTYTLVPSGDIASGAHTATIVTIDHAGNTSSASSSLSFTIDTSAPAAPAFTSPSAGSNLNDATPTLSGTGENGAIVTIKDENNATVCSATVSGGTWSCTASSELSDGTHTLTALQTDPSGNSSSSSSLTLHIDTVAPNAPTITSPPNTTKTNDTTPTITGTATANSTVLLSINGQAPITLTADGTGNWSYTPSQGLAEGAYSLQATERDAAGNVSAGSNTVQITIDTTAPTVTVNQKAGQADPTIDNHITYTIVFSEPIDSSSFGASDFTIGAAPTSQLPAVTTLTQVNATTWEAVVTGTPNNTTISLSLAANKLQDAAGNNNQASTSSDNSVRYEVGPPNIVTLVTNDTTPTVEGACIANHQLELALSGPETHTYTTACNNGNWSYDIGDTLGDGSYDIVVTDTTVGSLTNPVENQDNALTIDTVRPTVTVNKKTGQADPTATNEAFFTVIFSEPINAASFTANDLTVSGTSGQHELTQINATTWEVRVFTMTSGDTASVSLAANKVTDPAGNNNQASISSDNSVSFDNEAPNAPVVTQPANNSLSNNATITVQGTGENGAVITVVVDGAVAACQNAPVIVQSGSWSCALSVALTDDQHTILARQSDAAGNVSANSNSRTVTVDTTAPAQPAAPTLVVGSDTGESSSDRITSDTTPTFSGTCADGDTVQIFDSTTVVAEVTCANSAYMIATSTLTSGQHTVTVKTTDPAGNSSTTSPATTITIDTTAPNTPTITTPLANSALSDTTPTITGTGENGAVITLLVDTAPTACAEGVVRVTNNTWTCTVLSTLPEGTYALAVSQTDPAGNTSPASGDTPVTVDTTPPAAPSTPNLSDSSDTGGSNTDNLTNDNTPSFSGSCQNGTTILVYADGVEIAQGVCQNSSFTATPTAPLSDGNHSITMAVQDSAGNTSAPSQPLTVTIDTTASGTLSTPNLHNDSDTGSSTTDNLTNDNTPTFTGTCTTGETITIYADTALAGQASCIAGTYGVTVQTSLSDGEHTITVVTTDPAGNQSSASSPLTITIDTTAPTTPTTAPPASGATTNDTTPTITGTGEPTATVNPTDNTAPYTCTEGHAIATDGSWSCTPGAALSEGQHDIDVTITDPASNTSPPAVTLALSIDTTPPTTPGAPDLASASDTGTSNSDNLTSQTQPQFTGICETGELATLYSDSLQVGQATCVGGTYIVQPTAALSEGTHTIAITLTDTATNTSPVSQTLQITIDTSAATPANAPALTTSSDTGTSSSDAITSQTLPTFTGTCTTGESVQLYNGATLIGQGSCSGGTYTITVGSALSNGMHSITITVTDAAGNVSANSPSVSVTIDTTAPAAPVITTPPNNTATNNPQPAIAGTSENGNYIRVYDGSTEITCVGGSPIAVQSGTWSCNPASALATGSHTITAKQSDVAGNTSASSSSVALLIDITPPTRPARPDLIAASDSGASNTDNITNITTPTIAGTCTTGDTITLRLAGVTIATQACTNSAYSILVSPALSDGSKLFSVIATDPAGNASAPSLSLTVTIDTVSTKPATPDLHEDSDSGVSNTDNITNVSFPTIIGDCIAGESVRIFFDNVYHKTVPCFAPFLAQPLDNLSQGNHSVTVEIIDIAGNLSTKSDALTITIDNMAPNEPTVSTPAANTTPTVLTTSYTTSGTAEANTIVTVRKNGTTACSTIAATNGSWSCTLTNLPNGSQTYTYMATDFAGNPSSDVTSRTLNVNHP